LRTCQRWATPFGVALFSLLRFPMGNSFGGCPLFFHRVFRWATPPGVALFSLLIRAPASMRAPRTECSPAMSGPGTQGLDLLRGGRPTQSPSSSIKRRPMKPGSLLCLDLSTSQPLNLSSFQPLNLLTSQPLNLSTPL
jgi:hypothetical protein